MRARGVCGRARLRRGGGGARRGGARGRASARRCRSSGRRARRARGDGRGRRRVLRAADPGARGRGCDGDEWQDDDLVPALRDPRGSAAQAGPLGHGRSADRGRAARGAAHDSGGDRPAADLSRDARHRRPLVRDGGVVARGRAAPSRPCALRRSRLHEPQPGPPRLPRRHGDVLPGEAAALRRGQPSVCCERRRSLRAPARRGAARRAHLRVRR